jgi:hypothetical protein
MKEGFTSLKTVLEVQRTLGGIRRENEEAERGERNEARQFHRWCREHLPASCQAELAELERACPWLLEPDEPAIRGVPL